MPTGIYKRTKYHRLRLSQGAKGKKMKPFTTEHRANIGKATKRRFKNPEFRKKFCRTMKKNAKKYSYGKWMKGRTFEKSNTWKGGRSIRSGKRKHVRIYTREYCGYEHRFIVEKVLGRKLTSKEQVHHINGKQDDNRISNLMVFINNGAHKRFEGEGRFNQKEIVFDGRNYNG